MKRWWGGEDGRAAKWRKLRGERKCENSGHKQLGVIESGTVEKKEDLIPGRTRGRPAGGAPSNLAVRKQPYKEANKPGDIVSTVNQNKA